jgi:hypothetical protein
LRHLNDCDAAVHAPFRVDWLAKWASYNGGAVGATKNVERAFTAVSHWHFNAINAKVPAGMTNCCTHLGSTGCALELVCCSQYPHASTLRRA